MGDLMDLLPTSGSLDFGQLSIVNAGPSWDPSVNESAVGGMPSTLSLAVGHPGVGAQAAASNDGGAAQTTAVPGPAEAAVGDAAAPYEWPMENPTWHRGANLGPYSNMGGLLGHMVSENDLSSVPEDARGVRVQRAGLLLSMPRSDPNFYPSQRNQQGAGQLQIPQAELDQMSAGERSRALNRLSAENTRRRKAEHRDYGMRRVVELEAETAYLRAQVALLGGNPDEWREIHPTTREEYLVPVRPTAARVGQNSRRNQQQGQVGTGEQE